MNKHNVNQVVDFLSSKSGFLEGHDWLIDAARAGFSHIADTALVDNPKDKLDKDNKYIPGLYDSLFFNAVFKDTHDTSNLYTSQQIIEEETVVYCEEDYGSLKFSKVEQSLGVGLAFIASQVRDIYDEKISEGCTNLSDFTVAEISNKLGGLADMDFIKKPSAARLEEVPSVKVHRRIVNTILNSMMGTQDSVLFIGGDGGSGSKRRREYKIDCLYMKKKMFYEAKKNRAKIGGRGQDFLYDENFFNNLDVMTRYKVIMFNYSTKKEIFDKLSSVYKNTDVLVCGIVCDPEMRLDNTIEDCYDDDDLYKFVDDEKQSEDYKTKYGNVDYKVLAISPNRVAVYVDHGIFIDDRWKDRDDYIAYNRVDVMNKFSLVGTFDGIYHGSLKVLRNSTPFIPTMNFRLDEDNYANFVDTAVLYKVENSRIYDNKGVLYLNYTTLPDGRLAGYRHSVTKKMRFYDIDVEGSYWFRRYVLAQSKITLDDGTGLMLDNMRDFEDFPCYHTITVERMEELRMKCSSVDVDGSSTVAFDIDKTQYSRIPVMFMKGFYYNPLMKRWIIDPSFVVPYIVVNGDTPLDAGLDMEFSTFVTNKDVIKKDDVIKVDDGLGLRTIVSRKRDAQYIRLFNFESSKTPLGLFCIPPKKQKNDIF